MKTTLLTLILTFVYLGLFSQNPCTPVGADRCRNAPLINSCQLNGWYSNTDPPSFNYTDNDDIQNDPGWCNGDFSIENNQWLRFTAIEDHLFIEVDVSECEAGNGIQMGAYELTDANGRCPGPQLNCFGLASGANTSLVFEIENLTPGVEYLLMIDGWAGDGCPFLLYITSGIPLTVEVEANPLPICPGVDAEGALNAQITSGGGNNVLYGWSTTNGNIVSGDFDLNPIIDEPGDYTFVAYNINTCCWASETVTVTTTTELPVANASVVHHLGCAFPTATVTAEGSETDNGFNIYEYLWSFENGNPAGEGFTLEGLTFPGIYILTVRNVSTGCESQVQVEVLEDFTEPEIFLLNPPVLTCTDTVIFLSVDAPVGSTFEWSNDQNFTSNEQAPEIFETGTYDLTVTGANGCTSEASIDVVSDVEAPALQVVAPTLDCNNSSAPVILLNNNEETTYVWNGPSFSSEEGEPVISTPGTYFMTATNPNGCSSEYIVQVEEDITPPEISIDEADLLDCNLVAMSLNYSSADEIINAQWTGPDGFDSSDESPLINSPGTYTLTVTDEKGCTNTTTVEIEENLVEPELILAPDGLLACNNEMVVISGQGADEIVAYEWSDNLGTESTAEVAEAGQYFVTITGTNGCTSISEVSVGDDFAEPTPNAGPDAIITCVQSETALQGSGTSAGGNALAYEWSLNGNPIGNTETINVSATGMYTLTITDLENGCTASDEVEVSADENLPIVIVEDFNTLNCINSSILVSGENSSSGNNITYTWLDANQNVVGTSNQLEVEQAGDYTFVVTNNSNGCQTELPVQVADDFVAPSPTVSNLATLNCNVTSINLEVENTNTLNNISYQWYDSNTNTLLGEGSNFEISDAGNYNIIATNMDNGCTGEFPFPVVEDLDTPVADAGNPFTITCNETEALLDASGSQGANLIYTWFDENQNLFSEEASLNTSEPGEYLLIVTNTESGCTDEASVNIDINADFPEILVNAPTVLNCTQPTTGLDASNSLDANNIQGSGNLSYAWYDENNNLISSNATIDVDRPGEYILVLLDTNSGCEVSTSIQVSDDFEEPIAEAGPDQIITCDISTVTLDASNSETGEDLFYRWFNANNVVVGDGQMIEVDNPGTYTLVLSNIMNGCSSTDEVVVAPDENIPMAEVANDGILTCNNTEVSVFSTLPVNANYLYEWQNENGEAISNELSFVTEISGVYTLIITDQSNGCSNSSSILVDDNFNTPELSSNTPEIINCNNSSVELIGNVNNQNADVSYVWQDADLNTLGTAATLNVENPGSYTLTAFNNVTGCSNSISVDVIDNFDIETPTLSIPNLIDCNNQTAMLGLEGAALNGYTYAWYNQNGNLISETIDFQATEVGTYELIATNQENGCSASSAILVEENTITPSLNIPDADVLNCSVEQVLLIGQSDQGIDFTFTWTDSQGNIVGNDLELLVDEPGAYELSVLNNENGCSNISSIEVLQNINTPAAIIDDLAPLGLSCTQQSVLLDGSASTPVGNLQFQWFDDTGNLVGENPTYEATQPGGYQLVITDLTTFCVNENSSFIVQNEDLPVADIAPPAILNCNTSEVVLDAGLSDTGSEFNYTWNTPSGANFNDNDILAPVVSTPGTYTITVLNTSTGCENEFTIEVFGDFDEPIAQANAVDELDCVTSEVQINALGSSEGSEYSYTWDIDGLTITNLDFVTVQNPGQYNLIVTDLTNGCTQEAIVNVVENTEQPTDFGLVEEDISCFGFDDGFFQVNEIIGGTAPYTFTVNEENFDELPSADNLAPGVYPILVTDAVGCTLATSINIEEPPQVFVDLGEDITINLGETAYLSANSNVGQIDWYTSDSLECIQDCFLQQVSPLSTTLYEVEVMDENGCTDVSNITVNVQFDKAVYIPNAFSPNGDGINDFFRVFGNSSVLRVQNMLIADRWGEIVYEAEDINLDEEQRFWDGVHRGKDMNNNVLVYYVVVEYIDGRTEEFKGDVTIMK
jgi:gliding motility-associated-like protein